MSTRRHFVLVVAGLSIAPALVAQQSSIDSRLTGFDAYMVKDRLVFAKGYGYRDYGKKIPYTPTMAQPSSCRVRTSTTTT